MPKKPTLVHRWGPLVVAFVVIVIDQITKALVVATIERGTIGWTWGDGFLWLVHARNTGVAFSMGDALPEWLRSVLFIGAPLVVLVVLAVALARGRTFPGFEKWGWGLVLGGGLGNIIDRIARPEGVVDFVSVKLYGFLGLDRFAVFNAADAAVTVGAAVLIVAFLRGRR